MRLNKYIALHTNISRRAADEAIIQNRVLVNGQMPVIGQQISPGDIVMLDNICLNDNKEPDMVTIMLNKPVGYVCSKEGQGSRTVYELLPKEYAILNTVGRLDKNSSGLLLLTNDGNLHFQLTHPSKQKVKVYLVKLNKELTKQDEQKIINGITLEDGLSKLGLKNINQYRQLWQVTMHEGRNRQIRRTFSFLGYKVLNLKRINFGDYSLGSLEEGKHIELNSASFGISTTSAS